MRIVEHDVAPLARAWVVTTERELMWRIKAAFDPHGILDPGKGF